MAAPDLNLLIALDVLLAEGNVARAGRRLHLSPSATSRTLARLRKATGDPLLVRAGRGLVPTPRALAMRDDVSRLVQDATAALRPTAGLDLATLARTFALRTREGFVENFGPRLLARVAREAPGVRLHFLSKPDHDPASLRDGSVDFETGVVGPATLPDLHVQTLFRDRLVGVVRRGHALAERKVTPARFASARHVAVARHGIDRGPIADALAALRLPWSVAVVVEDFAGALALARACDLVASVPERHTGTLRSGMLTFPLPLPLPEIAVSLLWHPRMHADPAHRWLRSCIRDVCAQR